MKTINLITPREQGKNSSSYQRVVLSGKQTRLSKRKPLCR